MKESVISQTESDNAAAQAAGRGVLTTLLQRNPLVALGAALISPILGLFRRRGQAREINQLKVESYSSRPVASGGLRRTGGSPEDLRRITGGSRARLGPPGGLPWVRLPSGRIHNPAKGGCHHV